MIEYMRWMTQEFGKVAAYAITALLILLIGLFLVTSVKRAFSTKCRKCGTGLLQLGYMDSDCIWCPRCDP